MLKRALRILDTALKAFDARGWEVSLGKDDHNSYVTILGQRLPFGILEPRRQLPIPKGERGTYGLAYREEPSGRLALVLRESWGRSVKKSFTETEARPLEDRLNDFLVGAVALAHDRAEWERRAGQSLRSGTKEMRHPASMSDAAEMPRRRVSGLWKKKLSYGAGAGPSVSTSRQYEQRRRRRVD